MSHCLVYILYYLFFSLSIFSHIKQWLNAFACHDTRHGRTWYDRAVPDKRVPIPNWWPPTVATLVAHGIGDRADR